MPWKVRPPIIRQDQIIISADFLDEKDATLILFGYSEVLDGKAGYDGFADRATKALAIHDGETAKLDGIRAAIEKSFTDAGAVVATVEAVEAAPSRIG